MGRVDCGGVERARVRAGDEEDADLLHVALRGHFRRAVDPRFVADLLCRGFDTGYGTPFVLDASSVARMAGLLPEVIARVEDADVRADLERLAVFYRGAADAGLVVIVAEV